MWLCTIRCSLYLSSVSVWILPPSKSQNQLFYVCRQETADAAIYFIIRLKIIRETMLRDLSNVQSCGWSLTAASFRIAHTCKTHSIFVETILNTLYGFFLAAAKNSLVRSVLLFANIQIQINERIDALDQTLSYMYTCACAWCAVWTHMRAKIQFRFKAETIVCALWFLATIKILCKNMDSKQLSKRDEWMVHCVRISERPLQTFILGWALNLLCFHLWQSEANYI